MDTSKKTGLTPEEHKYLTERLDFLRKTKERESKIIYSDATCFHLDFNTLTLQKEILHSKQDEDTFEFWEDNYTDESFLPSNCLIYDVAKHNTLSPMDGQGMSSPKLYAIGTEFTEEDLKEIKNKLIEFRIIHLDYQIKYNENQNKLFQAELNRLKQVIN